MTIAQPEIQIIMTAPNQAGKLLILLLFYICRYGRRGFTHVVNDDNMDDDIPFVVDGG